MLMTTNSSRNGWSICRKRYLLSGSLSKRIWRLSGLSWFLRFKGMDKLGQHWDDLFEKHFSKKEEKAKSPSVSEVVPRLTG